MIMRDEQVLAVQGAISYWSDEQLPRLYICGTQKLYNNARRASVGGARGYFILVERAAHTR